MLDESLLDIIKATARGGAKQARSAGKREEALSLIGNLQSGAAEALVQELRE